MIERRFADALGVHVGDADPAGRAPLRRARHRADHCDVRQAIRCLAHAQRAAHAGRQQPAAVVRAQPQAVAIRPSAPAFANARNAPNAPGSWSPGRASAPTTATTIASEQQLLEIGSALLAMIAVAGIAVLVGGRMAEQTRRVGLLKAVGATPSTGRHRAAGREPAARDRSHDRSAWRSGGLIAPPAHQTRQQHAGQRRGHPPSPSPPSCSRRRWRWRSPPPRRSCPRSAAPAPAPSSAQRPRPAPAATGLELIELSSRLPVPLLLAVRLIARRPRRALLAIASVTIAVATFVATLMMRHTTVLGAQGRRQHPGLRQTGRPRSHRQHSQRDPARRRRDQPALHHLGHRPRRATTHRRSRERSAPPHARSPPGSPAPNSPPHSSRPSRHPRRPGPIHRRRRQPHPGHASDPLAARRHPGHPDRGRRTHRDPRPHRRAPPRRRGAAIRMRQASQRLAPPVATPTSEHPGRAQDRDRDLARGALLIDRVFVIHLDQPWPKPLLLLRRSLGSDDRPALGSALHGRARTRHHVRNQAGIASEPPREPGGHR